MDDYSWMYQVSSGGLRKIYYCNRVEGFIKYTLSNKKNISGCGIRCPCKRCKNKKFLDPDVVMMHLLQKMLMDKYLCWIAHREPYVPYETMVVRSTSNSSSVHRVIDDNSNHYKSMVMDVI